MKFSAAMGTLLPTGDSVKYGIHFEPERIIRWLWGRMTPGRQVPDSDGSGQNPGDLVVWIVKHKEQACEEFQLLGINIDMKEMGKCIK